MRLLIPTVIRLLHPSRNLQRLSALSTGFAVADGEFNEDSVCTSLPCVKDVAD